MTDSDALRAEPFFADLREEHLSLIAACTREVHFSKGDYLLRLNREITDCHFLIEGRVILETCDTANTCIPVQTLEAGAVLGWSWLLPPYQSFFDARALGPATTLALDCAGLREAMESNHELGYEFLKRAVRPLVNRLQACRLQLADVYADPKVPG